MNNSVVEVTGFAEVAPAIDYTSLLMEISNKLTSLTEKKTTDYTLEITNISDKMTFIQDKLETQSQNYTEYTQQVARVSERLDMVYSLQIVVTVTVLSGFICYLLYKAIDKFITY